MQIEKRSNIGLTILPGRLDRKRNLKEGIAKNEKVLIHCVGGLGRSGTVAALYLCRYANLSAEEAIREVRKARSERAIESKKQVNFIYSFAKSLS